MGEEQLADIFTKALRGSIFAKFCEQLGLSDKMASGNVE